MLPSQCTHCGSKLRCARLSAAYCSQYANNGCFSCAQLVQIEQKIEDTRRVLCDLLNTRDTIANAWNEHHDKLTSRLPVETVSKVFMHAMPLRPSLYVFETARPSQDGRQQIRNLVALSQISHRWRSIAHGSPELWSIVFMNALDTEERYVDVFVNWLKRSRNMPLFVYFRIDSPHWDNSQELGRETRASLLPHYHRLKVLDVQAPLPALQLFLFDDSCPPLSNLQSLSIFTLAPTSGSFQINGAPQRIDLYGFSWNLNLEDWSNLKHISLGPTTYQAFVHIFQHASSLSSITHWTHSPSSGWRLQHKPLVHSSLTSIEVSGESDHLWDVITTPNLQELMLSHFRQDIFWSPLRNFLVRSSCHLKTLEVCGKAKLSERWLLLILGEVSSLEELVIDNADVSSEFFRCLSLCSSNYTSPKEPPLLPNLKFFYCTLPSYNVPTFEAEALIPFLASRSGNHGRSVLRLVSVDRVSLGPQASTESNTILQNLIDAAKDIDLIVTDKWKNDLIQPFKERRVSITH